MADHATVADGLMAAFEGDGPQAEPVLSIATAVRFHPLLGLAPLERRPEAHQHWIGEEKMQALDIPRLHLA
jgi:hypothetical protein